eukprot:Lankesteria_metandrocarpae@DN2196_c1_g1_i1.p1
MKLRLLVAFAVPLLCEANAKHGYCRGINGKLYTCKANKNGWLDRLKMKKAEWVSVSLQSYAINETDIKKFKSILPKCRNDCWTIEIYREMIEMSKMIDATP